MTSRSMHMSVYLSVNINPHHNKMFVGISHCLFNHTHRFIHLSIIEGINLSYIRIGLKLYPHPRQLFFTYNTRGVCVQEKKKVIVSRQHEKD